MPAFPKFKTIITDYGKQRLIAAMSPGGTKLTLTQMAVGDGAATPPTRTQPAPRWLTKYGAPLLTQSPWIKHTPTSSSWNC